MMREKTTTAIMARGAYDAREDHDGNYGEDGIEKQVDELSFQAAQHGLEFYWHKESDTYTLEPMSPEDKAVFDLAMMQQEGSEAE